MANCSSSLCQSRIKGGRAEHAVRLDFSKAVNKPPRAGDTTYTHRSTQEYLPPLAVYSAHGDPVEGPGAERDESQQRDDTLDAVRDEAEVELVPSKTYEF